MATYRVIPFLVSELRLPPDEREELGVEWWPSYAHAVEHPGGIFLFDNGAGTGDTEVAPGLRLVPTPWHTAGHRSLVIDDPDGPVVFAGQAVRSRAEWEGSTATTDVGRPEGPEGEVYGASVARLRALDPVQVHFAHDPLVWER